MKKLVVLSIILIALMISPAVSSSIDTGFVVQVEVDGVTNFDGAQYDIEYDPSVIEVLDVTDGDLDGVIIPVSTWGEIEPGRIRVINNIPGVPGANGTGYLSEIHYNIIGKGKTNLTFSNGLLGSIEAEEILALWEGMSVQIVGVRLKLKK